MHRDDGMTPQEIVRFLNLITSPTYRTEVQNVLLSYIAGISRWALHHISTQTTAPTPGPNRSARCFARSNAANSPGGATHRAPRKTRTLGCARTASPHRARSATPVRLSNGFIVNTIADHGVII